MRFRGTESDRPIRLRKFHVVRTALQSAPGVMALVEELLPLSHHPVIPVVQDRDFDRQIVHHRRRQLLQVHLKAAIAGDTDDPLVGKRALGAQRGREPESHRAQPTGIDPRPRFHEFIELRRPHLVLADVGRDDRLPAGAPVNHVDHKLGFDHLRIRLVRQRPLALPRRDLLQPRRLALAFLATDYLGRLRQ